ncbi:MULTISPECIES: hypothetical protein [Azotobacter]|nr:hypothetical protein [Azotobacter vinelandii]WKN22268.1 hypothetical protein AVAEIV_000227 [Azotobacter vinelandii]GLK58679.1 hypothetical protein GCM10017624_08360 [Azotobacter vinelandii]SFX09255.1 hypothetical protein SAMN04244547_00355 [Azotobacter vinelandii]
MILAIVLFVCFACFVLFMVGVGLGRWLRAPSRPEASLEEVADDAGLFVGWDGLSPMERKRRLALYQQRVLARSAEQDRAWLQARMRECLANDWSERPRAARRF